MKWIISVRFNSDDKVKYDAFKARMLRSGVKGLKTRDFSDKHKAFTHICIEPANVLDYFYVLNPVPGDDILNTAEVVIKRQVTKSVGLGKEKE